MTGPRSPHRAWIEIDHDALRHNLAVVRDLAHGAPVIGVVKANAYGHGLMRVLPALEGADGLALVELDAALALREAHYTRRILLLEGFFEASELAGIARGRLAVVVHHEAQVAMLERAVLPRPIEVFVKVNTGMNRLGLAVGDVARACERLGRAPAVAALRLMMHFARADEDDGVAEALAAFEAACGNLPYPRSLANSAGVFRYGEVGGDYVRPGIMLYGATPFAYDTAAMLGLAPVMTLRSEIIAVQELAANDTVGYGAAFTATKPMRIGVVACGYADGYPRHAPNGTPILVGGRKARLAGRVSMDMITCDITDLPEARVGTPVVLWGEGLPVDDVAAAASTVGYELLCALAPRVRVVATRVGRIDLPL